MGAPMPGTREPAPIATLWNLAWKDDRLTCAVYRADGGMQLRIASRDAVMITERFDLQPRALARAQALRDALKRRGWQDAGPS
jgi:uncharacterized protein involved in copper resistance